MAFNVDALSEQVKLADGFKLATKAVSEAKLAKALISSGNFQAGVQGRAPIMKMDSSITLQKQGCGRVAGAGDTRFTEKYLEVEKLAVYKDICYDVLEGTYMSQALAKGDDPEDAILKPEYTNQILDKEIALVNAVVETALFQADKTSSDANLNKFDGIKKQLAGVTATEVEGATIVEKLQALYMAMPEVDRLKEDAHIFLSETLYEEYKLALWAKDRYREEASGVLAATSIKLFPTAGLNGSREVYAMRLENLQLGFNGSPESTKFDLWYDKASNIFMQNTFFSIGISVVHPEDVRKATV